MAAWRDSGNRPREYRDELPLALPVPPDYVPPTIAELRILAKGPGETVPRRFREPTLADLATLRKGGSRRSGRWWQFWRWLG